MGKSAALGAWIPPGLGLVPFPLGIVAGRHWQCSGGVGRAGMCGKVREEPWKTGEH